MKFTQEQVKQHLDEAEHVVKSANTPKPYEFNLIKDMYYAMPKDFWKGYQQTHSYIIIKFFDKNAIYSMNNGELVVEGVN